MFYWQHCWSILFAIRNSDRSKNNWHKQIKQLHFNLSFCKNVISLKQIRYYNSNEIVIYHNSLRLDFFNLNNRPNHFQMHFLKTKIEFIKIICPFFSLISLPIFRWWCNSWCNEYSRKSASSINCYNGGVFTCWQNMWLINAPVWPYNHFFHLNVCIKHCIKINFSYILFKKRK